VTYDDFAGRPFPGKKPQDLVSLRKNAMNRPYVEYRTTLQKMDYDRLLVEARDVWAIDHPETMQAKELIEVMVGRDEDEWSRGR
jgi:hypothetical protein